MSMTVAQIFAINPTTVVADTDLYYLVQSPYTPGSDAAITGADLKIAFGSGGTINAGLANQLAYYASAGSTLSGLTTLANGTLITSAGGVPSISQTLPAAVQSNITALGTITSGTWNGTIISGTFGGTGVNNGASTITLGGSLMTSGAFASTFTMTGITSVTFPVSGTLATTSQLLISPLTTKGDLWGFSTVNDRLPVGSTNGQVLQVSSGASLGVAYSTATYPTVANNVARILRSDGTNWVETTATFADTYAASSLLYANGSNNVAGLAPAQNGLLVSGNTSIPVMLAGPGTTGNMLISNAAAAPSFTTFTYPTTVGASGSIHMSNGTNIISSTSLWPNTVGANGLFLISNGTSNGYSTSTIPTSAGATANKVLLSDGTNYALSTPTFPNASATLNKIIKSDGTNWIASTETYAAPGSSGNVMTSDGTNWTSSSTASAGRLIAVQAFTASGTYTKTTGAVTAIVKLVGGGGGSQGSGSAAGTAAGTGGTTSLGAIVSATGGGPGLHSDAGGSGGVGSGGNIANLTGGGGQNACQTTVSSAGGGAGGNSYFGGGAKGGSRDAVGIAGSANTGGGASGATGNQVGEAGAGGGGAGGYCEHFWTISSPQTVTIGAGGTAGGAGTGGNAGAAGGTGFMIIYEYS